MTLIGVIALKRVLAVADHKRSFLRSKRVMTMREAYVIRAWSCVLLIECVRVLSQLLVTWVLTHFVAVK
jgi:hypothetical protein